MKKNENGNYTGVVYRYRNNVVGDQQFGWSYIGTTLDEPERRRKWRNPNTASYGGRKITEARKKYSPNNFVYEVLETMTGTDKKELRKQLEAKEEEYIALFDSVEHGYNTSKGGTGNKGHHKTAEEIAKMVETRKANGSYAHTEETKKKLSKAGEGRKHSPETIEKIRLKLTGLKRSPEQRKAQSERQKGRTYTPEQLKNMSIGHINGKHTPISKEGMERINAARYKIPVIATNDKTGYYKEFESMKAIERELGIKVGSVHNFLKTGNSNKDGYRFAYKGGVKPLPKRNRNHKYV